MTRHARFQAYFEPAEWFVLSSAFEHGFSMHAGPAMNEADRAFVGTVIWYGRDNTQPCRWHSLCTARSGRFDDRTP